MITITNGSFLAKAFMIGHKKSLDLLYRRFRESHEKEESVSIKELDDWLKAPVIHIDDSDTEVPEADQADAKKLLDVIKRYERIKLTVSEE